MASSSSVIAGMASCFKPHHRATSCFNSLTIPNHSFRLTQISHFVRKTPKSLPLFVDVSKLMKSAIKSQARADFESVNIADDVTQVVFSSLPFILSIASWVLLISELQAIFLSSYAFCCSYVCIISPYLLLLVYSVSFNLLQFSFVCAFNDFL